LIEQVGDLYFHRQEMQQHLLAKCGNTWQRRKHIYYDEEGIREEQLETLRYCDYHACGGYFTIGTAAEGTRFGDQSAFIVCLRRGLCPHCRSKAYDEALREKKTGKWQYVLVQDIATGNVETL
ncbi:MAG: histone deacetylase, partial [Phascolarctobacterium sp.]|nr:histone deacetylase [Phascolarctobacterium sp.]